MTMGDGIAVVMSRRSRAVLLIDFGLEDERHGGELLRYRHGHSGKRPCDRGNQNDIAEVIHGAPPLMTGEAHGMPIIMRGVMHRHDAREADPADDEQSEQSGGEDRDDR